MLTIGSLFSGIGGLELGIERATGARTIWQVEIDPYARAVLAKHWPEARRYEDVRTIGAEVERPDIVCGGFPCQDFSIAGVVHGKRKGLDGERSGLWSEYARILRVLRPRFVFVENVPEIVRMGALGRVLGDLAALDYHAEGDVFSAFGVGAWHLRRRWFLLAYLDGERASGHIEGAVPSVEEVPAGQSGAKDLPDWSGGWMAHARGDRQPAALLRRDIDGVSDWLDRKERIHALGNAVVPAVAEKAWKVLYERSMR